MGKIKVIRWLLILALLFGCVVPERSTATHTASKSTDAVVPEGSLTTDPMPMPTGTVSSTEPTPLTATPNPTPTQTLTPTAAPTPIPTPEPITKARLDSGEFDAFFDDAVFIGDSVTWVLNNYVRGRRKTEPGYLGSANFMGVISMNIRNAASNRTYENGVTFLYRGQPVSITQGIKAYEAKKAFIMLGTNDIDCHPMESIVEYYGKLIELLQRECPDTEIIFQCILPITEAYSKKVHVPIDKWNGFNDVIEEICAEYGVTFLRFGEQLMDERGYLSLALSSDGDYHLNTDGEDIWIRALRLYAAQRMHPDAPVILSQQDP